MHILVKRRSLIKAIGRVHRVAERKNTIPVLSNVLLRAEGESLLLKAADLGVCVSESLEASSVVSQGGTTVPAYVFYDIVRKLPEEACIELILQPDGETLDIQSGRSKFSLQALREEDFSDITLGGFTHEFQIPAKDLKQLLDGTSFAISNDETRYHLNGMYLHVVTVQNATKLRAVATDGHRLAKVDVACPEGITQMPGVIIPKKTVTEIQKLLENPDVPVPVVLSNSKISVMIGPTSLTSKLVDSTFPQYGAVIPHDNKRHIVLDRDEFSSAVNRVASVAPEQGQAVKFRLSTNELSLKVTNTGCGYALETLDAEYDDEDMEVAFNAKYLLDIANQLETGPISFKLANPVSAALIQNVQNDSVLYVLMPMQA